ncbi:transferase family-domain-containing protein [Xylaria bambusicola]|uniref:transferase family-domain-containing protein n=1 Tax=Xylaria bambusicola TaxID=326684 RepID=UPI002007DEFB|nr:transferase family-domain-containing protein [Xylaria bambusicola]KAI0506894.1 transferase family-domain-containing protein [Xylaria bambusicola]
MAQSPKMRVSPMDNVMPRIYANFILALRLKPGPSSAVHHILEESLRRTCDELPILRRKVFIAHPDGHSRATGLLEAKESPEWIPKVVFNDLSSTWPDYGELVDSGFEQDALDGQALFPRGIYEQDLHNNGACALLAQANFVEGGLLLAFGIFHPIVDGHSGTLLVKLWAKHAKALQQNVGPVLDFHPDSADYGLLDKIWKAENIEQPSETTLKTASPETWRLLGLIAPSEESEEVDLTAPPPRMRTTIFYVPATDFKALRAEANVGIQGAPNTANDALMAKLWRCIMKARLIAAGPSSAEYSPDKTSLLDLTLDGRARFSQSLPSSYMGTLVFITTTRMTMGKLTSAETSLAEIATAIRLSVDAVTSKRMQEAFGLARALPDYGDSLKFPFATFAGAEACFTSWVGLSAFDISFGDVLFANGGCADYLRPPRREFDAFCRRVVILPMQKSGGFEILVTLKEEEMGLLEKDLEFVRYAKVVCH